jgi:hypothetical protein
MRSCSTAAIWFLLALLQGCTDTPSFTGVEADRSPLIGDMASYETIESVKQRIGAEWAVIENSGLASGDGRPPFSVYTVSLPNYSDLGSQGELRLQFFNNRLVETRFCPERFEDYVVTLAEVKDMKLQDGVEAFVKPYTRIAVDRQSRCVAWQDARLTEEMKSWIKRYS